MCVIMSVLFIKFRVIKVWIKIGIKFVVDDVDCMVIKIFQISEFKINKVVDRVKKFYLNWF